MKNQYHVFLQKEEEVTALHQISNYRRCFHSCETSPPMLPGPGVSGWSLLPLGTGNYMSCLPTRQYCNNSPPSSWDKKEQCACRKIQCTLNKFLKDGLGVVRAETLCWLSAPLTTFGRGDNYNNGHEIVKRSPRTAGGVLPQCCQINGADSYRHLHLVQLGWSRCTQPLSCLTAGKETKHGDEQPCIWQIGIRACVSNTQRTEDVSNHSGFSLFLACSLPLRRTIKWEKQQRCRLSAARLSC